MDTLGLVVGNLCSLLAMIADSISASRKTVKSMLRFQNISQLIYCIGAIVLKSYSGAVQNAVSILRNMTAVGKKPTEAVEWTLIGLGVVLGLACNNRGFVGLLPVIANVVLFVMTMLFLVRQKPEKA